MTERVRPSWLRSLSLAALGGTLLLAPNHAGLMALTGFAGLALLSESLEHARGERFVLRAGVAGLLFGTCANATALLSLVSLLGSFARLAWPLAIVLACLAWLTQGLIFALGTSLCALCEQRGARRWLALPLCLTVSLAWVPAIFPWHVAGTQVGFLPFAQLADLGGEALLGLVLTLLACSLQAWPRARRRERIWLACISLAALGLPLTYGYVRLAQVRALRARAGTLTVGVVQSNVAVAQKHDEASARDNLRGLLTLTRGLERQRVDLTVWGETAYPYPLPRTQQVAPRDVRDILTSGVRGPILLGLETYLGFDDDARKYNSAWLVRRDGSLGDRVDKARLLAFGEYVPLWNLLPAIRSRYASAGFSAGAPGTVQLEQGKLGVLICYEDLFASSARATVALGARALVNLTNDAWFGDTREPLLHDILARLRAIELRRDLVRAVNTGVSSFTSATGEVLWQTPTFQRASRVAAVRLLEEQTVYARWGDWLSPCCLLGVAGLLLRRRREPSAT